MNDPARHHRCDVRDFVSDLMDFIKDQIGRAVDDPLDQFAATLVASGVWRRAADEGKASSKK